MYSFSNQDGGFVISKNLTHKFHSAEPFFPLRENNYFVLDSIYYVVVGQNVFSQCNFFSSTSNQLL